MRVVELPCLEAWWMSMQLEEEAALGCCVLVAQPLGPPAMENLQN